MCLVIFSKGSKLKGGCALETIIGVQHDKYACAYLAWLICNNILKLRDFWSGDMIPGVSSLYWQEIKPLNCVSC